MSRRKRIVLAVVIASLAVALAAGAVALSPWLRYEVRLAFLKWRRTPIARLKVGETCIIAGRVEGCGFGPTVNDGTGVIDVSGGPGTTGTWVLFIGSVREGHPPGAQEVVDHFAALVRESRSESWPPANADERKADRDNQDTLMCMSLYASAPRYFLVEEMIREPIKRR